MNSEEDIHEASEELIKLEVLRLKEDNYENLLASLSAKLSQLINQDFPALVQLLYRLDISENKLKGALDDAPADAAKIIAQLIIQRQLEKIESRRRFKKQEDIPEEDRW